MRLNDARIRTFAENLQRQPSPKITDANVIDILAAVGDGSHTSGDRLKTALLQPGLTRKQQFDLSVKGLTQSEKSDLGQLLDKSGFQMDVGAKNFLEALVGRAPLQESFGPLTITGDQKNGTIAGVAKAGEVIEAINLSAAPAGRLHLADTMVIGTADASGKFLGTMPDVREGDLIRMRTRAADGSTSDWLTIQAKGVETRDTRNAIVNLERMDLSVSGNEIAITHNTGRPLSEPGATLRFTNARTNQSVDVKVTENGSLPAGTKLPGRAGDEFKVAGSDGRNNTNFATIAGTLKVPGGSTDANRVNLPDPAMHKDEMNADGTPKFKLERFTGPLFIDEPKADDVRQGAIGNCYFPAALASVAAARPDIIKNMIKDNGDGTYTVKFTPSTYGGVGRPVEIKVDGDLYARSFGGPIYGGSLGGSTAPDKMELWYPLIEKAYAQWKGSYDTIGNGGVAGKVMSEVMGKGYQYEYVSSSNKDRVYEMIKRAAANKQPMAAGTYGTTEAARYTNTGVYANHAYSVLGVEEENGTKYVKVRNPWGQSEHGYDGKNDGFFRIELGKFTELYQSLHVINP
jgi:hypothetical protein